MGFFRNIGAECKRYDGDKHFDERHEGIIGITTVDVPGLEPRDVVFQVCVDSQLQYSPCDLCCFTDACKAWNILYAEHMAKRDNHNNIIRTFPFCLGPLVYFKQIGKEQQPHII